MTAQILLYTGIRKEPPPAKQFQPGDDVIIADYEWDAGETEIAAVVTSHRGEWVGVRIPDTGAYSVHISRVHPAPQPEAA